MSSSAINLDRMLGSDSPSLSPLSTAEELQREALQASIREKLLPAGGERRHRTALDIAYEYRRQHKPLLVLPGFKGHLGQLKRVRKNGRTIIPDDKRPASFQHWPATEDRREVITSPPSWLGGADGDVMYGPLVITVVQHEGPVNYLDTRPFGVAGDRRLVSDRGWQPGAPLPNLDAGAGSDASEVSPAGTSIETPTMGLSWGVPPAIQSLYRPPCGGSTLPQPPTDPAFVVHLPDGSSFSVADTVVDDAFLDVSADEVIRLAQAFEERVAGCTCAGGAAALGLLEGLPCSVGAGLEEREIGFRVAEMASNARVAPRPEDAELTKAGMCIF